MNSENDLGEFDQLDTQLHDQAMAERPAFSTEIHDRIMRGIRSDAIHRRSGWNPLLAIAAGILIFAAMISMRWLLPARPQVVAMKNVSNESAPPPLPISPLPDQPIRLTLNLDGVLLLRISPLEVSMTSPIFSSDADKMEQPGTQETSEPIGSPQWLLTRMQQPVTLAQATLADLLPPDVQRLIKHATMDQ